MTVQVPVDQSSVVATVAAADAPVEDGPHHVDQDGADKPVQASGKLKQGRIPAATQVPGAFGTHTSRSGVKPLCQKRGDKGSTIVL